METVVVTLTGNDTACQIAAAGQILKQGGLVAFPTETVYGLGADALNPRLPAGFMKPRDARQTTR